VALAAECQKSTADGDLWHVVLGACPRQFGLVHVESESAEMTETHGCTLNTADCASSLFFRLTVNVQLVVVSVRVEWHHAMFLSDVG